MYTVHKTENSRITTVRYILVPVIKIFQKSKRISTPEEVKKTKKKKIVPPIGGVI